MSINKDDLNTMQFLGEVVDVNDPDFESKIKVKIFGKTDELTNDEQLWAIPANKLISGSSSGSGFHSIPKVGSIVRITFDNGNFYQPIWSNHYRPSRELTEKFTSNNSIYENAQFLYYDTINNYFLYYINTNNDDSGFVLRLGADSEESNQIRIKEDNSIQMKNINGSEVIINSDDTIKIKHSNGTTFHVTENGISLGTENESPFHAMLYEEFSDWVVNKLIAKLGLITPIHPVMGPCSPLTASPQWADVISSTSNSPAGTQPIKSNKITLIKE